jgi:hypothetical protein
VLALPVAAWEFSFGVYMTVKGFKVTERDDRSSTSVGSATLASALA